MDLKYISYGYNLTLFLVPGSYQGGSNPILGNSLTRFFVKSITASASFIDNVNGQNLNGLCRLGIQVNSGTSNYSVLIPGLTNGYTILRYAFKDNIYTKCSFIIQPADAFRLNINFYLDSVAVNNVVCNLDLVLTGHNEE